MTAATRPNFATFNKKRPKRIMVEILAPGAANVKLNNDRILRLQSLESLVCARARKQVKQPNWVPRCSAFLLRRLRFGVPSSRAFHKVLGSKRWEYA